ncbi:hypothetical protein XO10_01480 [Marinitoga sp. 1135]|uniref:SiaC family regulatory phosphoprotein domain-containing protein n=1 Tax=Marinitoga piezophila (strain DSM 14283 / JCM 11233 / KA3) TaxID=443254 RepID=H2J3N3_MARPK|nr:MULTISPECIES: DUF1987 domain-containing protein [Marinitoga]AEX84677.1 protein of unknown function (DUF1987) [Marinitoga piezophila KA3]APT75200.1 hypothetical protein LN42_01425 [Marinitoga sp. 1137]NUU94988.1 hypothetical protein [Marinitoga sp. 1135]NUU96944.1 hypothetical protein [Marinitoga sp. 1138]
MEKLYIKPTKSTPEINFDPEKRKLSIRGESYPENSFEFYNPIFKWLEDFFNEISDEEVIFEFEISYLNTSSTKSIMFILDILEEAYEENKKIKINWYYDEDNEFSYEIAENFMEDLNIPFEMIKK